MVIGALVSGSLFLPKNGIVEEKGILGGPSFVANAQGAMVDSAAVSVQDAPFLTSMSGNDAQIASTQEIQDFYSNGAIQDPGQPIGPSIDQSVSISYKVHSGDNISQIAARFGITSGVIMAANPGLRPQYLKAGASITIPGGKSQEAESSPSDGLPNFNSEFIMPTEGYNWGMLHHYNAVDIANSCGTPVIAAADGVVIPDESITDAVDGWNGGYGNFVLLEHSFGNGVRTRYAHLEKSFVNVGDYVKQGQQIGLMGETGDATGCHLHFEVYGAKNPFAKG